MADEEIKQEDQEKGQEEERSESRLRNIERSQLRRAQATKKVRGKNGELQRRKKKDVKGEDRSRSGQDVRKKQARRSGAGKSMLIVFMVLAVGTLALLTTVFASAHIKITLASAELTVPTDQTFGAVREPAQSKDISYKTHSFAEVHEERITNVIRDPQYTRAEGTAIIYNMNPSGEPLGPLINRTRLKAPNGQIYHINGKQTIPGSKTVNGVFTPGTKEVKISAANVGDTYNLSEPGVRLSIPGLEEGGREEWLDSYATTKTEIVGGFSGEKLIPDEEEEKLKREQLREELMKTLRDSLAQSIQSNSLAERVVFDGGIFIEFKSLKDRQEAGAVVIREEGTLYAVSFREMPFAALLAKYTPSASAIQEPPARVDIQNLAMNIEKKEEFDVVSGTEFNFTMSGSAKLYWDIYDELFLDDVASKKRTEIENIIAQQYPQIKEINELTIFPRWRASLPENKEKMWGGTGKIEVEKSW